jgi:coenzyme F420 hydrogenase subunit beta
MHSKKNNVFFNTYLKNLCCSCGLCGGICPSQAIEFRIGKDGFLKPEINKIKCTDCGLCIEYCPGTILKKINNTRYNLFYGYSNDKYLRKFSSSGGIATELLCYLLEKNFVDKVVVVNNQKGHKNPTPILTDDIETVRTSCTSKYCPIPTAEIMNQIKNLNEKIAIVTLPCQAMGISNFLRKNLKIAKNVKFFISLLCNHVPSYNATDFLLKQSKIKKSNVKSIIYRGDGWPGFIRIETNSGTKKLPYRETCSLGFGIFFKNLRCQICNDPFGEYAGISFGDAYFLNNGISNQGYTFCIIRDNDIKKILFGMRDEKIIHLNEGPDESIFISSFDPLLKRQKKTSIILAAYNKVHRTLNIIHDEKLPDINIFNACWIILKLFVGRFGKYKIFWPLLNLFVFIKDKLFGSIKKY